MKAMRREGEEWEDKEAEAVRRLVAGDLPKPRERRDDARGRRVATAVAMAVRHLQHALADMREWWRVAGEQEVARRREEREREGMRHGLVWQWKVVHRAAEGAARKIQREWRRHTSVYGWQRRWEARRVEKEKGRRGGTEGSMRTPVWQGRREGQETQGELQGRRRRKGDEGGGKEGWTMLGALIMYMKGRQHVRDQEKIQALRGERERRREEGEREGEGREREGEVVSGVRAEAEKGGGRVGQVGEEGEGHGASKQVVGGTHGEERGGSGTATERERGGEGEREEAGQEADTEREGGIVEAEGARGEGGKRQREERTYEGQGASGRTRGGGQWRRVDNGEKGGRGTREKGTEGTEERDGVTEREPGQSTGDTRPTQTRSYGGQEKGTRRVETCGTGGDGGRAERKRRRDEARGGGVASTREEEGSGMQHRNREGTHEGKEHSGREREDGRPEGGGDGRVAEREAQRRRTESREEQGDRQEQGQGQASRSMRPTASTAMEEEWSGGSGRAKGGTYVGGSNAESGTAATEVQEKRERGRGMDGGDGAATEAHTGTQSKGGGVPENNTVNKGRPKRSNSGRPESAQKRRKRVERGDGRGTDGRVRYVEEGRGRGRVPLVQAIVVGRVCVVRTERTGKERTDAGRPSPDPG